jgi:hypothetical protein
MQELFAWQDAAAFGCITGSVSGVVVLDVDSRDAEILKGRHLPPTLVAETPRGRHYFYRCPPGGLATKAGILPKVDVRGHHGYVVLPGPAGRAWAQGLDDAEGLAETPKWLLAMAKPGAGPKPKQLTLPKRKPALIAPEAPQAAPVAMGSMATTLSRWYSSPDVALQLAPLLGIQTDRIGAAFPDVMPGMAPDVKPSASLYQNERDIIVYRSFRMADQFWTLGEVRASLAYGEPTRFATGKGMRPEGACWAIRLLIEGGLIQAAKVAHRPITDDAPKAARTVYAGFLQLLGCKWLYTKGAASPFSWRFAAAWCGMGHRQAGVGMQWLLSNGYLVQTGRHGRTALFMPRTAAKKGSE